MIANSVRDLPFSSTLKGIRSFLQSLNHYNKFCEDLLVVAAMLYELDEDWVRSGLDLDKAKQFVIIPHTNLRAVCGVLGQEQEGVIQPSSFTRSSRVQDTDCDLRSAVLEWLLMGNSADGRHLKWGLELSIWTLELRRVQRDKDGLAYLLGAGIILREYVDKVAENMIPIKGESKRLL
ncbi:reverse transcriptase [Phytophthora megakarya]|uniref:Reverse transcriptase n=1 Tax=Phytophthora megakarya TaxID=4795 RepID=A0A225UP52_9STRA|nr:reverse transcriptase [Phytophthora megakarya]